MTSVGLVNCGVARRSTYKCYVADTRLRSASLLT